MATLGDVLNEQGYVLPQCLTGHIGGESVPGSDLSVKLPIYYPGSGDALFELQEDGAEVVAAAVSCARTTFQSGVWSGLPVVERQRIFRAIAALIRAMPICWRSRSAYALVCRRRIWHRGRSARSG